MAETSKSVTASVVQIEKAEKDLYSLQSGSASQIGESPPGIDAEVAQFFAEAQSSTRHIVIDDETNRRLRWMVHKRTVMVITYFAQTLDKGTINFASIMGIIPDNHLHGQQYAWLTTCVYIAILIWEFPTNRLLQRLPIAKYLAFNIAAWGVVLACTAACSNFTGLVIVRTLLGIFECVCQPAFVFLSTMWYTREEQALVIGSFYSMNGFQQCVGGLIAYGIAHINTAKLKNWQILFTILGCLTFVWGIFKIDFSLLSGSAKMTQVSKTRTSKFVYLITKRASGFHTYPPPWLITTALLVEALKDLTVWAIVLISFTNALPTGGLGAFSNIILTEFGFTQLQTYLLAIAQGAIIMIFLFSAAYLSKKFNQRLLLAFVYTLPNIAGTIVFICIQSFELMSPYIELITYTGVPANSATKVGLLIAFYCTQGFGAVAVLNLAVMSGNVAGRTKQVIASSLCFVAWAVGNAIGPQVFQDSDKPRYIRAFIVHLVVYGVQLAAIAFLRLRLLRNNVLKARAQASEATGDLSDHSAHEHAFDDLTDQENPDWHEVSTRHLGGSVCFKYIVESSEQLATFLLYIIDLLFTFRQHIPLTMSNDIPSGAPLASDERDRIDLLLKTLQGNIGNILDRESHVQETIRTLQNELNVYKRAYADVDNERQQLAAQKQEADRQRGELELQLKGNRVVALLDGDGTIFSSNLISQGQPGGHIAAQKLADSILQHMNANYGLNQYQLWVYVFFNKRGLTEAFGRYGLANLKAKFDDFMLGFNQAAERFMMIDVGTTKEAADAKIKAYLEDEIRLPQTCKVLFGGCHDNGYVTNLRSQITAGFKHKLILLQSYADMAAGISELCLPSMSCPDLFMLQKLGAQSFTAVPSTAPQPVPHVSSPAGSTFASLPPIASPPSQTRSLVVYPPVDAAAEGRREPSALGPFRKVERRDSVASISSSFSERRDSITLSGAAPPFKPERRDSIVSNSSAVNFESLEAKAQVATEASPPTLPVPSALLGGSPPPIDSWELLPSHPAHVESETKRPVSSYSSAVMRRPPTPDLDSSSSSDASDSSDENASPRITPARHVNPNIPLSKHKPPPCTLFYLANCKYGSECKYAHNYLLQEDHYTEIRTNAKKAPCPSINKGEMCIWAEACCYGHVCPSGPKCMYYKQGRCKFTGVDMHKEVKAK
ncbi:hypothetical protein EYR40_005470 [Pleurotus pulmonarius]|nr:hypothetical protein EYR40_005470 [Pleurotus pulmonarius]